MGFALWLRYITMLAWEVYFMVVKLAFWAWNYHKVRLSVQVPTNSLLMISAAESAELIRTGKVR